VNDILNMEKFKQGLIFGDIVYRGMRPTDIDLVMEIRDKAWVIAEIKCGDKEVPTGQRLMLERLYNDLRSSGKKVICVVASHNTPTNEDIDASTCMVREYWNGGRWVSYHKATLKQFIEWFLKNII